MFEGVVSQVLAGYLGRYVKGIQKDQLKIGIWNEEILLEEVDLNLESFDYLQLPFALRQGRIGKLSIKIPWKKLGWDSINITLEDVFICTCRRDENEWSHGSVEKRELSAKMAKLNAAELAKFSNRVSGSQAGQSFITYITTKILDNIQVYIRNVHLVYIDIDNDLVSQEKAIFGLRLEYLTVKTDPNKQNYRGSYDGKLKGHVNKVIEITSLGIYCNFLEGCTGTINIDDLWRSLLLSTASTKNEPDNYLLSPFNTTISLMVNKLAKLEDCPRYMLSVELASLVISLDDNQLRQILSVWDYFSMCRLREKYGRYRPIKNSRTHGWQRKWWHYAQESILADVRLKLRKTSWRNLGWRITCKRNYVNLYKRKLEFIQQNQPVDDNILEELEQIENECDIEDILSFRSTAEKLLPESFVEITDPNIVDSDYVDNNQGNVKSDQLSSRARSWLSWLSHGLLGAGGTGTSSFSGVVSDEIIKDIYDVTEFHPLHPLDATTRDTVTLFLSSVKFNLYQVSRTSSSKRNNREIACMFCDGINVECGICEGKTEVMASISSTRVVNPSNEDIVLVSRKIDATEDPALHHDTFINVQLVIPPGNQEELSVSVMIQPFEFTCDLGFLWNLVDFQQILFSFEFHSKRVLSSLNGIEDTRTRLMLKAEYLLSIQRRFKWEASFSDVVMNIPLKFENSDFASTVMLGFKTIVFKSRRKVQSDPSLSAHDHFFGKATVGNVSMPIEHFCTSLKVCDLYDHFEIELSDFEGHINVPYSSHVARFVEKFNACASFDLCILFDEPLLVNLEVSSVITSVCICLSPAIYSTMVKLFLIFSQKQAEGALHEDHSMDGSTNNEAYVFHYSVASKVNCFTFQISLGDDTEDGSVVCFILKDIVIRCLLAEFLKLIFHMKAIKVDMFTAKNKHDNVIVCSSRFSSANVPLDVGSWDVDVSSSDNTYGEFNLKEYCYVLHYQAQRSSSFSHEFSMWLHDIDLHIHPKFFGELQQIYAKFGNQASASEYPYYNGSEPNEVDLSGCGVSDFYHSELISSSGIPLDCFPFITVQNSDVLSNLKSSFSLNIPEWENFQKKGVPSLVSQESNFIRRYLPLNFSAVKSSANTKAYSVGSSNTTLLLVMDVVLCGLQIYFHDSSCILGTIGLPLCKFYLSFKSINCWDILCSADGISFSSSWSPSNVQMLLGPAVPNISSILNIRARREKVDANFPVTELSFGIQHVSCTLPSEVLAMIIGYFALPDWNSNDGKVGVPENELSKNDEVKPFDVVYKFEILTSCLTLPVEGMQDHCIQLDLPLVYCSFIPESKLSDGLGNIPQEDMFTMETDRLDILNIFGHGISLLLLVNSDAQPLEFVESSMIRRIILIEKLDADLFIRIPCAINKFLDESTFPTIIMMKANRCTFVVQDDFLEGLETIVNAVEQFSVISLESKFFKSDAMQFMQLKRNFKDAHHNFCISPAKSLVEIKVSLRSLSIKLNDLSSKGVPSEVIAEASMQVVFAASLKNDNLVCLDVAICELVVHSFYSSAVLLSSVCEDPVPHHIWINLFSSDQAEIKILFRIEYLDIWLYLSDWNSLINVLHSCMNEVVNQSSRNADNSIDLAVKSENVSVSFHLPLGVQSDSFSRLRKAGSQEFQDIAFVSEGSHFPFKDNYTKFVKLTLKSKDIVLISNNTYMKLELNVEEIRAIMEVIESHKASSMPFILISDIEMTAELMKPQQFGHIFCNTKMNSVDVGLSYDVFKFWHGIHFITSEAELTDVSLSKINFSISLQKVSIMLSDNKVNIIEILVKDTLIKANKAENAMVISGICKLIVNYNNIHKVMWESFIEPWSFQLNFDRKYEDNHVNLCGLSDIALKSADPLNVNVTEPLIEAIVRLTHAFNGTKRSTDECKPYGCWGISQFPVVDDVDTKRQAPYILYNGTSLPISFWVSHGPAHAKCSLNYSIRSGSRLQPGSSAPIYVEEATDNLCCHWKASHSSDMYTDKRTSSIQHHMISIQIDGTSLPSKPMSMDLVGVSYFEVKFSDAEPDDSGVDRANQYTGKMGTWSRSDPSSGLVVPVVFDVSMLFYSKLIRVYSTVILLNALSTPLELRFDIPFGISPKILGPILPLQEFPLPLHLAETGQMRWRPVGSDYLWSDAHSLANLLVKENQGGFLRSFVCYPARPTSYPFRCCISVEDYSLLSRGFPTTNSFPHTYGGSVKSNDQKFRCEDMPDKWLIRQVKLTMPLLVRSCLPTAMSLTIESGGVSHYLFLAEDDAASVYHIDSSHDLSITFHIKDFMPTMIKFSCADSFMATAKLNESKFSLSETLHFCPDASTDHLLVNVEKMMDAFCGARELNLSVPFLLYNCTGIPLAVSYDDVERKRHTCILPASYSLMGQEQFLDEENGLALLSSDSKLSSKDKNSVHVGTSTKDFTISSKENTSQQFHILSKRCFLPSKSVTYSSKWPDFEQDSLNGFPCNLRDLKNAASHSNFSRYVTNNQMIDMNEKKVKACMYSPLHDFSLTDLMVRLCAHFPHYSCETNQNFAWSKSFSLVPTSGSSNVAIPHPSTNAAFLVSVTSDPADGLSGRTRSIIFQPRYVICNACSKDLCYKQKGTNLHYRLAVGQHSHIHWTDKTRELLISLRFNEAGGQWSGSFIPDSLGDVQVKLRNYVSGAINMVRVEVQNAGMSIHDENRIGVSNGTSGTILILLSDDNTGFMPYKIDNFSMEMLRVYQQNCEIFETVVHSYTSCQYAWDEPCNPHRLVIEVPGERVLGAYSFDEVKDYMSFCLPHTSEKPERRLFVGVHAEGAIKVLSIVDSSYHSLKDVQESSLGFKGKRKVEEKHIDFTERMKIHLPLIGISLIDSSPQELIFASVKETTLVFLQNMDQQRISFWFKSLQIDNQSRYTPYPIMLSFDHSLTDNLPNSNDETMKVWEENVKDEICEDQTEYVFHLLAAKWRIKEDCFVSFEFVKLRMSPLHVDLEGQVLLNLLNFFKNISSRLTNGVLQFNPEMQIFDCCTGALNTYPANEKEYNHKEGSSSCRIPSKIPNFLEKDERYPSIPLIIPIGAPWQQIFLLARKKKKIHIEMFEMAPIDFTLSFSSTPWTTMEGCNTRAILPNFSSTKFQRGLMALVDIEAVPFHLGELTLTHLMASLESIQAILARHYARQLLHEMYKVFGSVGVIGNPIGFIRNFQLGIKDFLSVFGKGFVQSPTELIAGMAQGSKSLLSNTVYAVSSATTQFSKSAHKGIIAFTFDEESVAKIEKQQKSHESHGKGILNEFFEGLTGLLQSPIRGAEEHGLPGFLSGIALGTAGLIARPVAGILEATGKTAQSIRNRSSPHQPNHFRVRLPRPVARDIPLRPYSWEEAIGVSVLLEADNCRLKEEILVLCKALKQAGRFIIVTYRIVLVIWCSNLVGLDSSDFVGIADPEWVIGMEMSLDGIIHMDKSKESVSIVGSNKETLLRQKRAPSRSKRWTPPTSLPLSHMSVELRCEEAAEEVLQVLRSLSERQTQRSGMHVLLRSNLR